jgi:hypothetical protein
MQTQTFVGALREASAAAFPRILRKNMKPRRLPNGSAVAVEIARLELHPADLEQMVGAGYFELLVDGDLGGKVEIVARVIRGVEVAGVREYLPAAWIDAALQKFNRETNNRFLYAIGNQRSESGLDPRSDRPRVATLVLADTSSLYDLLHR